MKKPALACLIGGLVLLVGGPPRGIPFLHRLIDCSFGLFGFIPLWLARKFTLELAAFD